MIHVVAIIKTKPGKRDEVLSEFTQIIPAVFEEEGCLEYGPTTDAIDAPNIQTAFGEDTFVVIEKWTTSEALDAHGKSSHMVAYGEKVKHLIDERVIHILAPAQ